METTEAAGNPDSRRVIVAALVGAVTISFSAIYFALSDVDPITGAVFRALYAAPVLFFIWWWRRDSDRRSAKRRWLSFAAGLMLGIDIVLWHEAINFIGAGLATLIANSQVIWVALGAWLVHRERPDRRTMGAVPVVLFGVALVSGLGQEGAFGSNPVLGAVLALVAAMFYSAFILGYRASNTTFAPPAGPLLEATVGAFVSALLLGLVLGRGLDLVPTFPAHGWLIALALTAQVFGWLLIGYALPRLPAVETATIILLQPVLTMVWGAVFFSESPSLLQMIGAVIVLGGVGYVAITRNRKTRPTDEEAGSVVHRRTGERQRP
ncbi:MAG: DMT family transporter [Actinobacteria bacterium]|nr:MAG: DMT family transporter [Actinomycetota bacterium]